MSFTELDIKKEYRPSKNNALKEFYIPTLSRAVKYRRAVGYFSSTSLVGLAQGLVEFLKNDGKIELIVSPYLSDEDIEAIKAGYEERDRIMERALVELMTEPRTPFEEERLNILATLIAQEKLDIKVVFTKGYGMYHEKLGLMYDNNGNKIAFSGSANETRQAQSYNYEVIDAYCSWLSDDAKERVELKVEAFDLIWQGRDKALFVFDFPKVARDKLKAYKKDDFEIDYDCDKKEAERLETELQKLFKINKKEKSNVFRIPPKIKNSDPKYKYQEDAALKWLEYNGRGIFDMATGTGKTITALRAVSMLSEKLNDKLGVVIIAPYTHLVEQWNEEVENFNVMNALICYGQGDKNYREKLKNDVGDFCLGVIENFCAIMTYDTYKSRDVQNVFRRSKGNLCIIVDEAHGMGAPEMQKSMLDNFNYRLGLSATVERKYDERGTNKIFEYFGQKCITYDIKKAINSGALTEYEYFPILVHLTEEELEKYNDLSSKIAKQAMIDSSKGIESSKKIEMLRLKRARIIAGAQNKIKALKEAIIPYQKKNHILVYCGTGSFEGDNSEEEKQIDIVKNMLGNDLNMAVQTFTAINTKEDRKNMIDRFSGGKFLQALIAIKCLDEGVNIPSIRTAFILASSTNPREYIQRRGRVLRNAQGKDKATIYDFITLPRDINKRLAKYEDSEITLILREVSRMKEFSQHCKNPFSTYEVIAKIEKQYKLNEIGGNDYDIWRA